MATVYDRDRRFWLAQDTGQHGNFFFLLRSVYFSGALNMVYAYMTSCR
jgi:hypothetical protein